MFIKTCIVRLSDVSDLLDNVVIVDEISTVLFLVGVYTTFCLGCIISLALQAEFSAAFCMFCYVRYYSVMFFHIHYCFFKV